MGSHKKGCTKDIKQCPNGTTVGRDPANHCEFYKCPESSLMTQPPVKQTATKALTGGDKINCHGFQCEAHQQCCYDSWSGTHYCSNSCSWKAKSHTKTLTASTGMQYTQIYYKDSQCSTVMDEAKRCKSLMYLCTALKTNKDVESCIEVNQCGYEVQFKAGIWKHDNCVRFAEAQRSGECVKLPAGFYEKTTYTCPAALTQGCTKDIKLCPDGKTTVVRDPALSCDWRPCPGETRLLTGDDAPPSQQPLFTPSPKEREELAQYLEDMKFCDPCNKADAGLKECCEAKGSTCKFTSVTAVIQKFDMCVPAHIPHFHDDSLTGVGSDIAECLRDCNDLTGSDRTMCKKDCLEWRFYFARGVKAGLGNDIADCLKDCDDLTGSNRTMCKKDCIESTTVLNETGRANCAEEYGTCGGVGYSGPKCCKVGKCYAESKWYSQCRKDCPSGWKCNDSKPTDSPVTPPVPLPTKVFTDFPTRVLTHFPTHQFTPFPTHQFTDFPTTVPAPKPTTIFTDAPTFKAPTSTPIPAPTKPVKHKLNVIGYWGNSGECADAGCIPPVSKIPPAYNVIIFNFINLRSDGSISYEIMGPHTRAELSQEIWKWKNAADPWGRTRMALISIGGANGYWPNNIGADVVFNSIDKFMQEMHLDGLDLDIEGGALSSTGTLSKVAHLLKNKGYIMTAAPEAAQSIFSAYENAKIFDYLTWVHPQFYNNPPNAVTTPYVSDDFAWRWPSTWQGKVNKSDPEKPFWLEVLEKLGQRHNYSHDRLGMLVPAVPNAASNNNHWDLSVLAQTLGKYKVSYVGCWAIGWDNAKGYPFAKAFAGLLGTPSKTTMSSVKSVAAVPTELKNCAECTQIMWYDSRKRCCDANPSCYFKPKEMTEFFAYGVCAKKPCSTCNDSGSPDTRKQCCDQRPQCQFDPLKIKEIYNRSGYCEPLVNRCARCQMELDLKNPFDSTPRRKCCKACDECDWDPNDWTEYGTGTCKPYATKQVTGTSVKATKKDILDNECNNDCNSLAVQGGKREQCCKAKGDKCGWNAFFSVCVKPQGPGAGLDCNSFPPEHREMCCMDRCKDCTWDQATRFCKKPASPSEVGAGMSCNSFPPEHRQTCCEKRCPKCYFDSKAKYCYKPRGQ